MVVTSSEASAIRSLEYLSLSLKWAFWALQNHRFRSVDGWGCRGGEHRQRRRCGPCLARASQKSPCFITKKTEGYGLVLTKTDPTDVLWKSSFNLFDSYLCCDLQFTFCARLAKFIIYKRGLLNLSVTPHHSATLISMFCRGLIM